MNKILSIDNISKTFYTSKSEIKAIDNITFDIYEGDFIAIVGPSGCGKSTLLSIINKQEKPNTGKVEYDANIGYMLQNDSLFEWLTVLDNCLLGLKIKNKLTDDNKQYVLDLLNKYGLKKFINNYPNSLSGGMRQRVALIRTLALKPDILLADEPFSALDFQSRINISNDIFKILKAEKKTLILVTHDIQEAITICKKIIVLTKRPAKIKNIYNIDINEKEPIDKRKDEKFNEYFSLIWKDIDYDT